ncbi:MAG: class I SAM-dependent methyltransferase [Burkholderiales bacterium]
MEQVIYHAMRTAEDEHWWFVGRRAIVRSVLSRLSLPASARILDIGCGTGGNLSLFSEYGEVVGIEPEDLARKFAQERCAGVIYKGGLPGNLPTNLGAFDVVFMLDVLEHLDDDSAALRSVAKLLRPEGRIVIAVPAFPILWGPHDEEHHHRRRYRHAMLARRMADAGLTAERITYFNTWLFPVACMVRLIHRLVPSRKEAAGLDIPFAPINRFLAWVLGSERHLIGRFALPFGVSLLAVARKT